MLIMSKKVIFKITSYLSFILSIIFLYELIKEFINGLLLTEIDTIPLIITLLVLFNLIIISLSILKIAQPILILIVFQILIIILVSWALFQIYNSNIGIIDHKLSH